MRFLLFFSIVWGGLTGFLLDGADEVRAETRFGRAACTKLALELKSLEEAGVDAYLKKAPAEVLAAHGRPVVEKVRRYIGLSEQVLFRCPRNVLNATAAPIEERAKGKPPLPVKGPKRTVRLPLRDRSLVPLPVPRRSSFRLPTSQS